MHCFLKSIINLFHLQGTVQLDGGLQVFSSTPMPPMRERHTSRWPPKQIKHDFFLLRA